MTRASVDLCARIQERATLANAGVPSALAAKLGVYYELLFRWNRRMNLTGLSQEDDDSIDRLLVEPLLAASALSGRAGRLIDIGSGGGSPAIPLKLAAPQYSLTMVESKSRKSSFLREANRVLGLEATVVTARFEEIATQSGCVESFDVLSVRAVRSERQALNVLQKFLKPGGTLLLFHESGRNIGAAVDAVGSDLLHQETQQLLTQSKSAITLFVKAAS